MHCIFRLEEVYTKWHILSVMNVLTAALVKRNVLFPVFLPAIPHTLSTRTLASIAEAVLLSARLAHLHKNNVAKACIAVLAAEKDGLEMDSAVLFFFLIALFAAFGIAVFQ